MMLFALPLIFILLLLALAPGILLMLYYANKHVYRVNSGLLILMFGLGVFSCIPAALLEHILLARGEEPSLAFAFAGPGWVELAIVAYGVVAIAEESVKYLALRLAYSHPRFTRVIDGMVYGAVAALGFACLENVVYVMGYGPVVAIPRAFLAVPGHALFGAVMGYGVGLACRDPRKSVWYHLAGFGGAVALHGTYDYVIFLGFWYLTIPLSVLAWFTMIKLLQRSYEFDSSQRDARVFYPRGPMIIGQVEDDIDIALRNPTRPALPDDIDIRLR